MDINDVLTMTPEEFAAAWNKDDGQTIINLSYERLGVTFAPEETTITL